MPRLTREDKDFLVQYLDADPLVRGNQQVHCPFHEDTEKSASLTFGKGFLHCFGECGRGWKLVDVVKALQEESGNENDSEVVDESSDAVDDAVVHGAGSTDSRGVGSADPVRIPGDDLVALAEATLVERLGEVPDVPGLDIYVEESSVSPLYGYLVFQSGTFAVARNLLAVTPERPRYRNSSGEKGLLVLGEDETRPVWLVEGIFDALALYLAGVRPVAVALTNALSKAQLYQLRDRVVYVAFDADYAGFEGTQKTVQALRQVRSTPIPVELPAAWKVKDPAEAWQSRREEFKAWLMDQVTDLSASDVGRVARFFGGRERPLLQLTTGIPTWDRGIGGFRDGVHGVGGEPEVGKTAYAVSAAEEWATQGYRGLYVTYEVPVSQVWARVASKRSARAWEAIELDPTVTEPDVRDHVVDLASRLRIVAGWTVDQIYAAAPSYDFIVIDYLQRMPGDGRSDDDEKAALVKNSRNISRLSDIARDFGKVILLISSIPRSSYGDALTLKSWKYAGDIEYVAQSLTGLRKTLNPEVLQGEVVKGTRGGSGTRFWLRANLGHCLFTEHHLSVADTESTAVAEQMRSAFK